MFRTLFPARPDAAARVTRYQWSVVTAVLVLAGGLAWVLAIAPAFVEFGLAVAAAVAWCVWLERHPDPLAGHPQPTPDGGTRLTSDVRDRRVLAMGPDAARIDVRRAA
jgi:hypothetical protein